MSDASSSQPRRCSSASRSGSHWSASATDRSEQELRQQQAEQHDRGRQQRTADQRHGGEGPDRPEAAGPLRGPCATPPPRGSAIVASARRGWSRSSAGDVPELGVLCAIVTGGGFPPGHSRKLVDACLESSRRPRGSQTTAAMHPRPRAPPRAHTDRSRRGRARRRRGPAASRGRPPAPRRRRSSRRSRAHPSRHAAVRRWARARRDPGVATGLALTLAAAVAIGGVATLGLVAYLVRGNDALRRIDAARPTGATTTPRT